jgi:hypothetical protein
MLVDDDNKERLDGTQGRRSQRIGDSLIGTVAVFSHSLEAVIKQRNSVQSESRPRQYRTRRASAAEPSLV